MSSTNSHGSYANRKSRTSSESSLVVISSIICIICLLDIPAKVEAHILVYRRLTNQLIEEYNDMPAQFGPPLPVNGIKVFVVPAQPEDACKKINPPPQSSEYPQSAKFVAIVKRGGADCTFEIKVRNAQAMNYHAVVVYNNESDDLEHMSAKNASGIMIPSVFVGHTTGMNLKSFDTPEIVLVINDELPFNINTQLILPFSILIGLCFLIMIFYMIYKCIREERRLRRHRLPKRMLKKLPIIKYTKNSDLAYDTCVICLDDFAEGDKLRVLPCRHPYHSGCIDVWLTENKRDCPICKRKVFTKGETRSQRSRHYSLDNATDTDDDTTPLLHNSSNSSANTLTASNNSASTANTASNAATTRHGTFRHNSDSVGSAGTGDATSDDENMLSSPARRINPFDRSPNLPPHLAAQLNSGNQNRSVWSWPVLRWFRRPISISIAAPPYHEDILSDVIATNTDATTAYGRDVAATGAGVGSNTAAIMTSSQHSSNNILNPNLSGSFRDDDDAPMQSIYEPVANNATTSTTATSTTTHTNPINSPPQQQQRNANSTTDSDSVFIQTPTQGGIAVAALPHNNVVFW